MCNVCKVMDYITMHANFRNLPAHFQIEWEMWIDGSLKTKLYIMQKNHICIGILKNDVNAVVHR